MTPGILSGFPAWRKILIGTGIALISFFIFTVGAAGLASFIYGVEVLTDETALQRLDQPAVIAALKLIQVIGGEIGLFIVPSLLLAWLFSGKVAAYLSLSGAGRPAQYGIVCLLLLATIPLVNFLVEWNGGLTLPGSLAPVEDWMRSAERDAGQLTQAFLAADGMRGLAVNLMVVAVLPALGEELLFRGVLQRLATELTRNVHAGIFLSAFVFSAIHVQFFGFVPRLLLGMYFGYLLYWSGSLWLPVAAHFLNNAGAVIVSWLVASGAVATNPDEFGVGEGEMLYVAVSVFMTAALLYAFSRTRKAADGSSSRQAVRER